MVQKGILYGYTPNAAVVVCNALNGLAISAVLKYADNIARVYAHAIAMMLTMGVSTQLFDAPITPQLVLAVTLVATSTFQYNLPQSLLHDDALSDEMQEVSSAGRLAPGARRVHQEHQQTQPTLARSLRRLRRLRLRR